METLKFEEQRNSFAVLDDVPLGGPGCLGLWNSVVMLCRTLCGAIVFGDKADIDMAQPSADRYDTDAKCGIQKFNTARQFLALEREVGSCSRLSKNRTVPQPWC